MPIREQKLLFDHVREGEKVLHLLETSAPTTLMEQCSLSDFLRTHMCFKLTVGRVFLQDDCSHADDDLQFNNLLAYRQAAYRPPCSS